MRLLFLAAAVALACSCSEPSGHNHHHPVPNIGVPDTVVPDTTISDVGADAPPPSLTPLVDMYAFEAASDDPWGPAPNEAILCTSDDWKAEDTPDGDWFDISTEFCNHATVAQPLLAPVATGQAMQVLVYFSSIEDGDGPYTVAAAVGDPPEVIWETTVDPPAEDTVLSGTWVATRDVAAGEPAYYHVSNHGMNVWSLFGWNRLD